MNVNKKRFFGITVFLLLSFCVIYAQDKEKLTLNLEQSIKIALKNNYGISIAMEKKTSAEFDVGISRASLLPGISSSFSYARLDEAPFFPSSTFAKLGGGGTAAPAGTVMPKKITIGDDENYSFGVQFQQPVYTGGKITGGYNIAKYNASAAEAQYEQEKNDLLYKVTESFWNVLKAQEYNKLMIKAKEQALSHMEDVQNMYKVGMVTENDLLRTKVQLSNIDIELIKAENAVKLSKTAFCNVLGLSIGTNVELYENISEMENIDINLEESVEKAMQNRNELIFMDYNLKIADESVRISKAGYLPDIFLSADYSYQRPNRQYNPLYYTSWTVALSARINIFSWGQTSNRIAKARSQKNQVIHSINQVKSGIELEVTNAYLKLEEASEKIKASELSFSQAQENYRVSNALFKEGMVSNTELLDAHTMLTSAETEFINSKIDYHISYANFIKSIGGKF